MERPGRKTGASPALAGVIAGLARKNAELLGISAPFARGIRDTRLALEVDLIQTLAEDLNTMLMTPRSAVANPCIIPRPMSPPCSSNGLPGFRLHAPDEQNGTMTNAENIGASQPPRP